MARQDRIEQLERLRYQRRGIKHGSRRRGGGAVLPFILLCACLVVAAHFAATGFASVVTTPTAPTGSTAPATVTFSINQGDTLTTVGNNLAAEHIIGNATVFYWYARLKGLDSELIPGAYKLRTGSTWDQVIAVLAGGAGKEGGTPLVPVTTVKVSIPEGYRIEEIAATLAAHHVVAAQTFLHEAKVGTFDTSYYTFLQGRPKGATLEGYLFPNTYDFAVYTDTVYTARQAIGKMLDEFNQQVAPALRTAFKTEGLTLYEGITMASLVQREGQLDSELPLIAAVYMNRLHNLNNETNGYLGVDAAQRYFLGYDAQTRSWWAPITPADYNVPSPYNTFNPQYGHPGLPFGPICSPGLKSIQAAAHPARTDYQYYIAKGDGSHAFATTLAEFNTLKAELGY